MRLSREERKARKQQQRENKIWSRSGRTNRHHIKNKCNGGTKVSTNMLTMDVARHNAFHFLFKNLSFREVAELLLRTCQMKGQEDY